jgi:hypothetical protein
MSTETIYARVPVAVKEALDAYASAKGSTLTGAVVDLIERGLEAATNEDSVAHLQDQLGAAAAELSASRAQLQMANAQNEAMRGAYAALSQRLEQTLGKCPGCGGRIRGRDVFVEGRCPSPPCGRGLTSLLVPSQESNSLDRTETLLAVGAVGVLLAIALMASRN